MSLLQISPRLILSATTENEWSGEMLILPVLAPEQPTPETPDKKVGELLLTSGQPSKLLVSVGSENQLKSASFRKAGEAVGNWFVHKEAINVGLPVQDFETFKIDNGLSAFCEGLLLGAFQFTRHKSEKNNFSPVEVHLLTTNPDSEIVQLASQVNATIQAVNLAREWSHEPPNVINPVTLAERVQTLAAETGLKCTIFGETELTEMGAGAILSVGLGSKTPSQMIISPSWYIFPRAPSAIMTSLTSHQHSYK